MHGLKTWAIVGCGCGCCIAWAEDIGYSQLRVWLIGVANTKATIVALVASAVRFLTKPSPFFA